ncbi:hypothetical protein SBRCBS47491_003043 [Sporothrix bragantina]|uniref:Uncharacterized protein n=1 Tax=Sporothrix bragantina TaxID=671064 RepID=A0ABP0BD13_9PEZI
MSNTPLPLPEPDLPANNGNQANQAVIDLPNMAGFFSGSNGDVPANASNHAFVSSFMTPMRPEMLCELLGNMHRPPPPFTKGMRDLQARGKDPFEYTRKGDAYFEERIKGLRKLKKSDILLAGRPGAIDDAVAANQSQNPSHILLQNQILLQDNQQTPAIPQVPQIPQVSQVPQAPPGPVQHGNTFSFPYSNTRASDYANVTARSQSPPPERVEDPPLDRFENLERRRQAALVLDSPELLMMYAQSMNDSIPSVRMKFMRELCGFDSETLASPATIAEKQAEAAQEEAEREEAAFQEALLRLPSVGHSRGYPSVGPSSKIRRRPAIATSLGQLSRGKPKRC